MSLLKTLLCLKCGTRCKFRSKLLKALILLIVGVLVWITAVTVELGVRKEEVEVEFDYDVNATEDATFPTERRKVIVFGSKFWGSSYPFIKEVGALCPRCKFTTKSEYLSTADAMVVHGADMSHFRKKIKRRKGPRPANQVWVMLYFEAPLYMSYHLNEWSSFRNQFNWTMTYRRDADIVVPYGRIIDSEKTPRPPLNEKWAFIPGIESSPKGFYIDSMFEIPTVKELRGRKMAAFVSSHCETDSKREILAKELGKYIRVDVYGNCGNYSCAVPKEKAGVGIDCRFQISNQYKFYLAFENSICDDYVTEKYFDTLFTPMIPIVYGGANYSAIAPKRSFINVVDFRSVRELAEYLIYLDNHPDEFLKYFEWRNSYWVQNNMFASGYCSLCDKLWDLESASPNDKAKMSKTYPDLKSWWNQRGDFEQSGRSACVYPDTLPVLSEVPEMYRGTWKQVLSWLNLD